MAKRGQPLGDRSSTNVVDHEVALPVPAPDDLAPAVGFSPK